MITFSKKISRLFAKRGNTIVEQTRIKSVKEKPASNPPPTLILQATEDLKSTLGTTKSTEQINEGNAYFSNKKEAQRYLSYYAKTNFRSFSTKVQKERIEKAKAARELLSDRPNAKKYSLDDIPITVPKYTTQTMKGVVYYIVNEQYYIGYVDGRAIITTTGGTYNLIKNFDPQSEMLIGSLFPTPVQMDEREFSNVVNAKLSVKELEQSYRLYRPTPWDKYTIEPLNWVNAVKVF